MTRIIVRTDGGKVRIRLQDDSRALAVTGATGAASLKLPNYQDSDKKMIVLSHRLINMMEIRVESAFRPNEEGVEIAYALSGAHPSIPDTLHKLTSSSVVEEAAPDHIISSARGMIEHIIKEREDEPKLVIALHTHPQGISKPGDQDRQYFQNASQTVRTVVADANIMFGVHAMSSESIRERQEPIKTSKNVIKWSSVTREHEVAFYTPDTQPYEVEIIG